METYLRCYIGNNLKSWPKWLLATERCYNTTAHSSLSITPFEALYGFSPPRLLNYVPGISSNIEVDQHLQTKDQLWSLMKEQLSKAQHRMKQFANRNMWRDIFK